MLNLLKSKPLFPLIFIVLAIFPSPTEAQVITICNDTSSNSNYPSNSQFQTNLNRLLTSLIANTSLTGFYNTTIGENPDRVYGLALCRGDISSQDCRSCVNTSTTVIISTGYCPNKKKATMKYNNCLIRYSDERFFSELVTEEWGYFWRGNNISNPDLFNRQLNSLMSNLSSTAASDDSKFQTGMGPYTDFTNIYGLVQCTRDLSGPDCLSCLQFALTKLPTCCYIKPGAEVVSLSCFIKYELFSFFRTSPPPPPRLDGSPTDTNSSTPPLPAPPKEDVVIEDVVTEGEDTSRVESFLFDLTTIATATNNFSDANKLGQGGFGTVYKGILFDGQEIAVKRLSRGSTQGLEELRNEVVLLANLQHRNLVRLLGCCLGEQEKLLIYEYIPNTSLDKFLFDSIKRFTLDWQIRYKIIGGIARGLLYLHEDSQIRIIHRDLKASNILLAGDMSPKIADFGLARLFGGDQSEDNTNRIAGTLGYMAPEYVIHGQFSRKSDVYSFGVLVLEIVAGRKNSSSQDPESAMDLLSNAWQHWSQGTPLELLDQTVREPYPQNEVLRCIHMGLLCVQEDASERPTMSSVVLMLNSFSVTAPAPSAPAFFGRTHRGESDPLPRILDQPSSRTSDQSRSEETVLSHNDASITDLYPR